MITKQEPSTAELVAHYTRRQPKRFVQLDGFSAEKYAGDSMHDEDGDGVFGGVTWELMAGSCVRVLIDPDTDPQVALRLLGKITGWVERGGIQTMSEPPDTPFLDDVPF